MTAHDLSMGRPADDGWLRPALVIFLFALAANGLAASFIARPGYMDAYYYFGGARRLAQGFGFTEPYLWNYLDDPAGLPHPSHLYWMPLTSILAAGPMAVCGVLCSDNAALFRAGQIPSLLLASLLPVISFLLARRVVRLTGSAQERRIWPLASAWFTLFAGFYFVFWTNIDSFALFGVVGSLALVATGLGLERSSIRWFGLAGLLAGLGHLTRADGLLLMQVVLWYGFLAAHALGPQSWLSGLARLWFAIVAGYGLVMLPWFARNLAAAGSLLAPGGSKALWLTSYNELFNYPAHFTPGSYLAAGWVAILQGKWDALLTNAQTALAAHGLIALSPFVIIGLIALRRDALFRPALLYAAGLYFAMTFVFTFPGPRGGLLHSGTGLLPFCFAAAPVGLGRAVRWAAARRPAWNAPVATQVFLAGLAAVALLFSLVIFVTRVVSEPGWNNLDRAYGRLGDWLAASGDPDSVVVVNDPPGFHYFTGHPAVVVPNGGVEMLLAVASRYQARWVVVDTNAPDDLQPFYEQDETSDCLRLAHTVSDPGAPPIYLYEIICA